MSVSLFHLSVGATFIFHIKASLGKTNVLVLTGYILLHKWRWLFSVKEAKMSSSPSVASLSLDFHAT